MTEEKLNKGVSIVMIEEELKELQETWDYTTEELYDIKQKMVNYALAAVMDSSVQAEVEELAEEFAG